MIGEGVDDAADAFGHPDRCGQHVAADQQERQAEQAKKERKAAGQCARALTARGAGRRKTAAVITAPR